MASLEAFIAQTLSRGERFKLKLLGPLKVAGMRWVFLPTRDDGGLITVACASAYVCARVCVCAGMVAEQLSNKYTAVMNGRRSVLKHDEETLQRVGTLLPLWLSREAHAGKHAVGLIGGRRGCAG